MHAMTSDMAATNRRNITIALSHSPLTCWEEDAGGGGREGGEGGRGRKSKFLSHASLTVCLSLS